MKTHQRTIPSPTALNRESVFGSMGRTCWQSGSFSRAELIQFTKANLSSSEAVITHTHTSVNQVTQRGTNWLIWLWWSFYSWSTDSTELSVSHVLELPGLSLGTNHKLYVKLWVLIRMTLSYQRKSAVCLHLKAAMSLRWPRCLLFCWGPSGMSLLFRCSSAPGLSTRETNHKDDWKRMKKRKTFGFIYFKLSLRKLLKKKRLYLTVTFYR